MFSCRFSRGVCLGLFLVIPDKVQMKHTFIYAELTNVLYDVPVFFNVFAFDIML